MPTAHETAKYTAVAQKMKTIRNCKPPGSSAGKIFVGRATKLLIFSQLSCDGFGSDDTNPLQTLQSSITPKTANVLARQMATRTRAGIFVPMFFACQGYQCDVITLKADISEFFTGPS